ncbi:MAG: ABC transporter ATP-binding protein [Minwuia sp.]|uniref:ABC transporter ATP-binding protein n=1 Tax=Minwuia sp. TaxID=2493630 RepID=UPI003A8BF0EB
MNANPAAQANQPVLKVEDLKTHIFLKRGTVQAVDGVSFHVNAGETLGLVGESGSGKSMTSLSILRLIPKPGARTVSGRIEIEGVNVLDLDEETMVREIRGKKVSMISQDPMTSLNPVFSIGEQVGAAFRYHDLVRGRSAIREAVVNVLRRVRIPSPERRLDDFPHQYSGGMRQRVVAAMAIACSPRLMIADEPTSNLDVTIQVQIIRLLREIQKETGVGLIFITHDMGVAANICDRVAVMYAGRIVEIGDVGTIFANPSHPYTQGLLDSIPHLGRRRERLYSIPGNPPDMQNPPQGCRFAARCPHVMERCKQEYPPEETIAPGHTAACWLVTEKK